MKNWYLINVGGYNDAGNKVELYDCESDEIRELSNLNVGRYRHAFC